MLERRRRREGGWEGKAKLTSRSVWWFSCGALTNILEAGIHRSVIKIHTADSQWIQVGIVMTHHLNTHTHHNRKLRPSQVLMTASRHVRVRIRALIQPAAHPVAAESL